MSHVPIPAVREGEVVLTCLACGDEFASQGCGIRICRSCCAQAGPITIQGLRRFVFGDTQPSSAKEKAQKSNS